MRSEHRVLILQGWQNSSPAMRRLPFPARVVYSSDDPFCAADRALQMAADWGAPAQCLGAAGHVNAASGLGDWPEGLLRALGGPAR